MGHLLFRYPISAFHFRKIMEITGIHIPGYFHDRK